MMVFAPGVYTANKNTGWVVKTHPVNLYPVYTPFAPIHPYPGGRVLFRRYFYIPGFITCGKSTGMKIDNKTISGL